MAIGKPRGREGKRPVYVYDPALKRKVYVGARASLKEARALERTWQDHYAALGAPEAPPKSSVRAYAAEWLEHHHGPGTRRPAGSTLKLNATKLRPFLERFGDHELDGGIGRREALAWSREHPHNATAVAAMFNDAMDDEACKANPFANRRHEHGRERKHIHPLTEAEVGTLADIAFRHWQGYGPVAKAWVLFGAWVGCRPGETFRVAVDDLDFRAGTVTIRRVKKRGREHPVDTVVLPQAAQDAIQDALPLLEQNGPMFRTVRGEPMYQRNTLHYYWNPVRAAFQQTCSDERWSELLDGTEDGKNLDFYALRHFCASLIVARGGNEYDVAAQLGNSPEVARETYIHSYRDERNARNRGFLAPAPRVVKLDEKRRSGSEAG